MGTDFDRESWFTDLKQYGVAVVLTGDGHYRNSLRTLGLDFQSYPVHIW